MDKKQLILINPANQKLDYDINYEPVALGIIASKTNKKWDIKIIDERVEELTFPRADLVGITATSNNINRAYEISAYYNNKNTKTVIGGTHASLLETEVKKYCSSVAVGAAESIWEQILTDFDNNCLKDFYYGSTDLNYHIDRSYYNHKYKFATIQFSRGCPNRCDFCCVAAINKGKQTIRNVKLTIQEIEKTTQKIIFFTDDNLYPQSKFNRESMIELFKKMIEKKLNKIWFGFASIDVGIDDEFLFYARKSGCRILLLGIETENQDVLKKINKNVNVKHINNINTIIKSIHKHRIAVCGAFITALEEDDLNVINKRIEFIKKSKIDLFFTSIYTPFPKTMLYERLKEQKRLIYTEYPKDWEKYNQYTLVFKHKNFTDENFFYDIQKQIRGKKLLLKRFFKTLMNTRSASATLFVNFYNFNHTKKYFKKLTLLNWINNIFEIYLVKYSKKLEKRINKIQK